MALALNIGKCSLLGNYRENNEDSIDVKQFPDMTVCLVADGMGGQAAGEVASKRAVEIVPRELKKHLGPSVTADDTRAVIRRAIVQANEEIMAMAALDRELKNMGTTIVLTLWRKGSSQMYVAGMGDSRVYLVRKGKAEQLTVDHSIAQALVEAKTISAAEAQRPPLPQRAVEVPRLVGGRRGAGGQADAPPGRRPLPALHGRPERRRLRRAAGELHEGEAGRAGVRRWSGSAGASTRGRATMSPASSSRWPRARCDDPGERRG